MFEVLSYIAMVALLIKTLACKFKFKIIATDESFIDATSSNRGVFTTRSSIMIHFNAVLIFLITCTSYKNIMHTLKWASTILR